MNGVVFARTHVLLLGRRRFFSWLTQDAQASLRRLHSMIQSYLESRNTFETRASE